MEIGMLIHYNIATYTDLDGCNNVPHYVPAISLFDPSDVNTKQWASVIDSLGAKYATLVAKLDALLAAESTSNETAVGMAASTPDAALLTKPDILLTAPAHMAQAPQRMHRTETKM